MELDWYCTDILEVRHPCLMWTFMKYSACWRSKKVLVSTSDVTPLISGQNRVVIVSSVIAKIFNPSKCWTVMIQPFEWHSRFNQCSFLFSASYSLFNFCSVLIQFSIQCSIQLFCSVFVLFSKCSALILEMCSRYFDPVNNNHQQSINIVHQTAPSFVLV